MSPKKKDTIGVAEIKTLLFTGSMVAILGFWYIFSRQENNQNLNTSQGAISLPAQSPPGLMLDLPPLPTLIPSSGTAQGQDGNSSEILNQELRSVAAPTQQVIRRSNVIIDGSKGRNGGGAPVARTSSS